MRSATGEFLAVAAYSPHSQIVARVWDWEERAIDARVLRRTHRGRGRASGARFRYEDVTDAMRLVHGESDGLPGVVADRYGDVVVVQLLTRGRRALARGDRRCPARGDRGRRAYGSAPTPTCGSSKDCRPSRARCAAPAEPARVTITESGLRFEVDLDARAQDRLLPRPARQPPARARARRRPRRARRLLLHRRLRAERARGRRPFGARHRQLGRALELARAQRASRTISPARNGSKATCSASCASCATRAAAST